jgi:hypothetical protein
MKYVDGILKQLLIIRAGGRIWKSIKII